ncbi:glycoside hydrolase family 2 protein [Pseudonocardia nigra]|uniref:glycoside hydrolase family 2 protein n=1 Tax=Pseudonocardia nigra TaxID=1921578 RepID=UPI0027E3ACE9|nr:glycoside hydrolase family 2 TIM barrel-domain containing protein [Pseudonocardia nigra]
MTSVDTAPGPDVIDPAPEDPRAGYPRPQLMRADWFDLSGTWRFGYDDEDRGVRERWFDEFGHDRFDREIRVPYPPESPSSGIRDTGHHVIVWYQREFTAAAPDGHRVLLHFGAVDHRATVWINGAHVAEHEGGHTPFTVDVTDHLISSAADEVAVQSVVVRAEDDPTDVMQPRGKQDWRVEPHAIWYHRTTGIWQPVWLETVPELHVQELHWTPDPTRAIVTCEARLAGGPAVVTVVLRLGEEVLAEAAAAVSGKTAVLHLDLPAGHHGQDLDRLLWSPGSPTLLDAEVVVHRGTLQAMAAGDRVSSYVGYRSVGVADGAFLLNGKPYFLRLALEQGYWPESHLAAPDADALRREVELAKELGFNGVRIHQKIEDPRYLYWCDRLGLLVWGEMPSVYAFGPTAVERLTREWLEVLRRDRSHPCIVTWVPLNESWGVPHIEHRGPQRDLASALYHLTRSVDPTRPVVSNDGWEHTTSDLWTVHDYGPHGPGLLERYGDPDALRRSLTIGRPGRRRVLLDDPQGPARPVVISEFGGLSYAPASGEPWFGYSTVASPEDLLAAFDDLVGALLDSPGVAGFCYTQLTDTDQERNGLLTADRKPKVAPDRVRAVLNRPARAVPAEEIDRYRAAANARSRAQNIASVERD